LNVRAGDGTAALTPIRIICEHQANRAGLRPAIKSIRESDAMRVRLRAVGLAIWCIGAVCVVPANAQQSGATAPPTPAATPAAAPNPGRDLVAGKCFQCHTDSMFRDGRMDRLGWEASIYRMIGRGGQYTTDEIRLMADYLGAEFGPHVKPAAAAQSR
jgi:hypothetical protein